MNDEISYKSKMEVFESREDAEAAAAEFVSEYPYYEIEHKKQIHIRPDPTEPLVLVPERYVLQMRTTPFEQ